MPKLPYLILLIASGLNAGEILYDLDEEKEPTKFEPIVEPKKKRSLKRKNSEELAKEEKLRKKNYRKEDFNEITLKKINNVINLIENLDI